MPAELGIPPELIERRKLSPFAEASTLVCAEVGDDGREHLLMPGAADAWRQMKSAAQHDGVEIYIVSAYRSISRQVAIIRRKLDAGISIEEILKVTAPPGYSEHHSGRAVDLSTPGAKALEVAFEDTRAFRWLRENAVKFGYTLSYPPGNPAGYDYEPWHWCHGAIQ